MKRRLRCHLRLTLICLLLSLLFALFAASLVVTLAQLFSLLGPFANITSHVEILARSLRKVKFVHSAAPLALGVPVQGRGEALSRFVVFREG